MHNVRLSYTRDFFCFGTRRIALSPVKSLLACSLNLVMNVGSVYVVVPSRWESSARYRDVNIHVIKVNVTWLLNLHS